MPAFAFWKASRQDRVQEPLLLTEKDPPIPSEPDNTSVVPKNLDLDLDTGNEDNGVFLFHEAMIEPHSLPHVQLEKAMEAWDMGLRRTSRESKASKEEKMGERSIPASPKRRSSSGTTTATQKFVAAVNLDMPNEALFPAPLSPSKQAKIPKYDLEKLPLASTPSTNQNSTVCTHNNNNTRTRTPSPRPTSFPAIDIPASTSLSTPPLSPTRASPPKSFSPTRTDSIVRLRRPADLNLGTTPLSDASSPRSELEQRQAVIRNSKSQSKAALRSPTTLLQERLNIAVPRKDKSSNSNTSPAAETKIRIFTPPPLSPENGCWLPGPGAQVPAFTSTAIRARTEASQRPAWWCKFDKLVVFDGICVAENGEERIMTRTSKGLSIARRQGDVESIVIPLDCAHCQEMLNRQEWKYDMRVCKRSVCWDCRERCRWEVEEERRVAEGKKGEGNRVRADSVLQEK